MPDQPYEASTKRLASMTGILYLLVILTGVINEILVRNSLFVSGDSAATVHNILAYGFVFRAGFVISLIRFAIFILLVLNLHKMFRPVPYLNQIKLLF